MSLMWLDDQDTESAEYDEGIAGLDDGGEGEDLDAESRSAASRRRLARQRRVALARRRQARTRAGVNPRARGALVPARATPPQAAAAIRELDLETKVQEDTFRTAIAAQGKRMSRSEYASVVGVATNQFMESFDAPDNPYAAAGLRFAPLLLLSPQRRAPGMEGVVRDPRFIGAAAVAAITFLGEGRKRLQKGETINVLGPQRLNTGQSDQFVAEVKDARGKVISNTVDWGSSDPNIVSVGTTDGKAKAGATEAAAYITATFPANKPADAIKQTVRVEVVRPASGGPVEDQPPKGPPGGGAVPKKAPDGGAVPKKAPDGGAVPKTAPDGGS